MESIVLKRGMNIDECKDILKKLIKINGIT